MRRRLTAAAGLVASGVALFLVLRSVDLGAVAETIGSASVGPMLVALAFVAVTMVLRAWRWQRLLPRPVAVLRILPVLLVGYLGNIVLPARLGEPIRSYLLARREDLSFATVFGTAVLERIVDLAVLAVMASAAAAVIGAPAWLVQLTGVAALGAFAVVGLLALVGLDPLLNLVTRFERFGRIGFVRDLRGPLERFSSGVGGRVRRVGVLQAIGISVPIWMADSAICLLVAQALGLDLSLAECLVVVAVGAVGTAVPSAPGYIGTYELAVSSAAGAFGIATADAVGLAVVLHAITLVPVAIAGAVSLVLLGSGGLGVLARAAELEGRTSR